MDGPKLLYQVSASIVSKADCDAYLDWLRDGHVADVVAAGAQSGTVAVEAGAFAGYTVVCSYVFASAEAFATYEAGPASALRAEGIALFGPESGRSLTWSRFVGEVVYPQCREAGHTAG